MTTRWRAYGTAWELLTRSARPELPCLSGRILFVYRFDSRVLKRLGDSHSELHHFTVCGLWGERGNITDKAGSYLRSDQSSQFNG